jgi:hypothetical protein
MEKTSEKFVTSEDATQVSCRSKEKRAESQDGKTGGVNQCSIKGE